MKSSKFPIEILTPAECNALLRACSRRGPTGARNRALIVVLWRGGLRCAEAMDLLPKDLDDRQGTIRVLHGKGDRSRTVGLDDQAWATVAVWVSIRATLPGVKLQSPLLCTLRGKRLHASYIRALMKRLAAQAGIDKRVHAHGLRHTFAVELARERVPLHIIQHVLGHASVRTTSGYIGHVEPHEVISAIRARPKWKTTE